MANKQKVVWVGSRPVTPLTTKDRKEIPRQSRENANAFASLSRSPWQRVDFITHVVSNGTMYSAYALETMRTAVRAPPSTITLI